MRKLRNMFNLFNILNVVFFILIIIYIIKICMIKNDEIENVITVNSNVDRNSQIVQLIKKMDEILLAVYPLDNQEVNNFSEEYMINFAIQYINKNHQIYKDKIIKSEKKFVYEINGTVYCSNEYTDKKVIIEIVKTFFGKDIVNVESSLFYDKENNNFSLVSIQGESINVDNYEVVAVDEKSGVYVVDVIYIQRKLEKKHSFKVKYYINKTAKTSDKVKLNLSSFYIYDSVVT